MAVGDLLRNERERRRLTLAQLAAETRIPQDRLVAFEREGLPPDAGFYPRAQIRAYARALKLDERVVLKALDQQSGTTAPVAVSNETKTSTPRLRVVPLMTIACVIAVVLIGSVVMNRRQQIAPATPAAIQREAALPVREPSPPQAQPNPSPASVPTVGTAERVPELSAPREVATAPVATQIVVTSQPEGARVTVDGIGWGVTPVTIRHLAPGFKRIRLTSDGYATAERVVEVSPDRATSVFMELRAAPLRSAP